MSLEQKQYSYQNKEKIISLQTAHIYKNNLKWCVLNFKKIRLMNLNLQFICIHTKEKCKEKEEEMKDLTLLCSHSIYSFRESVITKTLICIFHLTNFPLLLFYRSQQNSNSQPPPTWRRRRTTIMTIWCWSENNCWFHPTTRIVIMSFESDELEMKKNKICSFKLNFFVPFIHSCNPIEIVKIMIFLKLRYFLMDLFIRINQYAAVIR